MFRVFCLIICTGFVGFMAGFVPVMMGDGANAQIYLRKGSADNKNSDSGPPPSIYLRKDNGARGNNTSNFAKRRQAEESYRIINNDIKALKYWEESGRQPQSVEEIRSYANAFRIRDRLVMLEERSKVMPALEAAKAQRLVAHQAALFPGGVPSVPPVSGAQDNRRVSAAAPSDRARSTQAAKPRAKIYRRPSNAPAAPSRVFKDYR